MVTERPELRVYDRELRREKLLPDAVLGTALFVGAEIMLFSGFISAFIIVKANYPAPMWPPPGQPRLPAEITAVTTTLLLISGALLWKAGRAFEKEPSSALRWMVPSLALGTSFIAVQGLEWARLLGQGLTLTSSSLGSFFYMIVGAHALHAIPALFILWRMTWRLRSGRLDRDSFTAARMFWYFVVLVWPVLYWKVYL